MHRQTFKAIILSALLGAAGCGSIPESYVLPKGEVGKAAFSIEVADRRPESEKVMRVEESQYLLIIRYGDGNFSESRLRILGMRLQKELASEQKNVRIEVTRFETTVSRAGVGIGSGAMRPQTQYVVTRADGSIPGGYVAGSVIGNTLGTVVINSEWFRSLPSAMTYPSTMIQGTVNGLPFLGNNNAGVKVHELDGEMPKVIDAAVSAAVLNIKRQLGSTDASR